MERLAAISPEGVALCATVAWDDQALHAAFDAAPLAPASIRTYNSTLNMIARCHALSRGTALAGGHTATNTLAEWLLLPSIAWPAIKGAYPAARTQHQMVKTTLAAFKYALGCGKDCLTSQQHSVACNTACGSAHSEWHTILRHLDQQLRAQVASSEMSTRETAAWVDHTEVRAAEESLRTTEYGSPKHLLLAFAALTEPFRGGDAGRIRVCTPSTVPEAGNYIELQDAESGSKVRLVLRLHKTAHAANVGELRRVLPHMLATIVKASLQSRQRDWLFEAPRGGPFSEEAHFTAWANRQYSAVFGRAVTANTLRHSFISQIDVNLTSTAALEATAKRMGHSLATQLSYRRLSPSRKRKAPPADDDGEMLVSLRGAAEDASADTAATAATRVDPPDLAAAHALLAMSTSRAPTKEPRRVQLTHWSA